jgi:hypothetical protein
MNIKDNIEFIAKLNGGLDDFGFMIILYWKNMKDVQWVVLFINYFSHILEELRI